MNGPKGGGGERRWVGIGESGQVVIHIQRWDGGEGMARVVKAH